MTTRARALSLLELIFSMSLLLGLFVLMGSALQLAIRWNDLTHEVVSAAHRFEIIRSQLARETRAGAQPVGALSLGPEGDLVEEPAAPPRRSWSQPETLVLRGEDGYVLLGLEGDRLVQRRIDARGEVQAVTVLREATRCTFPVQRDPAGRAIGVEFRVEFREGPEVAGFVALRTTPYERQPLSSPARAPRFRGRR
jgi:hypothetical protein